MVELADVRWNIDYDGEDFTVHLASGEDLLGQMWKGAITAPSFIYVVVHGLGVMATFKKDLFPIINAEGGVVFACDHKGHGRSPGPKVGCTIEEIVEETILVLRLAHDRFPALPIIVHGHSMGGLTVQTMVLKAYAEVADLPLRGAIVEAPWMGPNPQRLLTGIRGWVEWLGLKGIDFVAPTLRLPTNCQVYNGLAAPEWVELMEHSPLVSSQLTTRLYFSAERLHPFIQQNPLLWPAALPLLFLHGESDDLVTVALNAAWADAVAARPDVIATVKKYADGPHVLLKSAARPSVIGDILAFIRERTGQ